MSKSYLDIIQSQWDNILSLYLQYEDKRPVMLFDLDIHEVSAFPYEQFKARLDQKSQQALTHQYEKAVAQNHMVVFVKDDDQDQFVSYSLKIYED